MVVVWNYYTAFMLLTLVCACNGSPISEGRPLKVRFQSDPSKRVVKSLENLRITLYLFNGDNHTIWNVLWSI